MRALFYTFMFLLGTGAFGFLAFVLAKHFSLPFLKNRDGFYWFKSRSGKTGKGMILAMPWQNIYWVPSSPLYLDHFVEITGKKTLSASGVWAVRASEHALERVVRNAAQIHKGEVSFDPNQLQIVLKNAFKKAVANNPPELKDHRNSEALFEARFRAEFSNELNRVGFEIHAFSLDEYKERDSVDEYFEDVIQTPDVSSFKIDTADHSELDEDAKKNKNQKMDF